MVTVGFYVSSLQRVRNLYLPNSDNIKINIKTFLPSGPHGLFMCLVWISKQKVFSSITLLSDRDFVTLTECFYCAVRTEC